MAADILVDAGFLIGLLNRSDACHRWAVARASELPPPWLTCEAVLFEAFHLLGRNGTPALASLLRRKALLPAFSIAENIEPVIKLIEKYSDVPMSLADACIVRMTEIRASPVVLTTDQDFRVYRRHSRQVIPAITPE